MYTVIDRLVFMDVLYDGKLVGDIEKVQRTASVFITGTRKNYPQCWNGYGSRYLYQLRYITILRWSYLSTEKSFRR